MTSARIRLIIDNDFSGDPDGLVQLAHHALSPSVDIRLVIGSHLPPNDTFTRSTTTADDAVLRAERVMQLVGNHAPVVAGSNESMVDAATPVRSAATRLIINEAMRDDPLPLFVACGGSLTEIASALVSEPRIADRLTIVWIGGPEHPETTAPLWPNDEVEYNLAGDVAAATTVFSESTVELWQVPRDAYRQCLASLDELAVRMRPQGQLGAELYDALLAVVHEIEGMGLSMGDTFCLGDSPLVLLTALQSSFNPSPSSSEYRTLPAPRFDAAGGAISFDGRPIRVHTRLDVRLMLEDLYAKLQLRAGPQR